MTNPWYNETAVLLALIAATALFLLDAHRIAWPAWRETAITTAMVFVMVAFASVSFLVADRIMRLVVALLLDIGN